MAIASSGDTRMMKAEASQDAATWTPLGAAQGVRAANHYSGITYGANPSPAAGATGYNAGRFVAVSYSGTHRFCHTRPTGTEWTCVPNLDSNQWQDVTFGRQPPRFALIPSFPHMLH